MEKTSSKSIKRIIPVVVAVQVIGLLCLCVMKYNMDVFLLNYRTMESQSYSALLAISNIEASVNKHENLVLTYLNTNNKKEMRQIEKETARLREQIEDNMIICDVAVRGIKTNILIEDYDDISTDAIRAYLNSADLAYEIKQSNSRVLADYLYENNMIYYMDKTSESLGNMDAYINAVLNDAKIKMNESIRISRISFIIGALAFMMAAAVCIWYCDRVIMNQEKEEKQVV